MAEPKKDERGEPEPSPILDLKHCRADITREIRDAMIRTRQPSLSWVEVRVSADKVVLSGYVYTRAEFEFAGRIAEGHARGLPISNRIRVWWAETPSRVNE